MVDIGFKVAQRCVLYDTPYIFVCTIITWCSRKEKERGLFGVRWHGVAKEKHVCT
jgi:hypothetical protein